MNRRDEPRAVLASGINRQTVPPTLLDYFNRFGAVSKAILNVDDNEEPIGSATIVFR